jgi:hypothetical protein
MMPPIPASRKTGATASWIWWAMVVTATLSSMARC